MTEVTPDQLLRWAAALTLADSYMSLVYHRHGIERWDTPATPSADEWQAAFIKARQASEELTRILSTLGVDGHAIASEMDRPYWAVATS